MKATMRNDDARENALSKTAYLIPAVVINHPDSQAGIVSGVALDVIR